ncbi:g4832 [Coccomyxa elongata]
MKQTPYIVSCNEEALASATTFKDFMGRGVPAFAATLEFVDVHLINVSGSKGNCFPQCILHAMTCLDGAIPAHWGVGAGDSLEDQAVSLRGWLRGKYSALLAEAKMAGDARSAADCERVLGSLVGEEHVFEDVAKLIGQEAEADVYVMRPEDVMLLTAERYCLHKAGYFPTRSVWMFMHADHFQFVVCRSQLRLLPCPSESADGIEQYCVLPDARAAVLAAERAVVAPTTPAKPAVCMAAPPAQAIPARARSPAAGAVPASAEERVDSRRSPSTCRTGSPARSGGWAVPPLPTLGAYMPPGLHEARDAADKGGAQRAGPSSSEPTDAFPALQGEDARSSGSTTSGSYAEATRRPAAASEVQSRKQRIRAEKRARASGDSHSGKKGRAEKQARRVTQAAMMTQPSVLTKRNAERPQPDAGGWLSVGDPSRPVSPRPVPVLEGLGMASRFEALPHNMQTEVEEFLEEGLESDGPSDGCVMAESPPSVLKRCPRAKQVAKARAREDAQLLDDAIARRNAEMAEEGAGGDGIGATGKGRHRVEQLSRKRSCGAGGDGDSLASWGGSGVGARTLRTCVRPAVVELDIDTDTDSDVESVEGTGVASGGDDIDFSRVSSISLAFTGEFAALDDRACINARTNGKGILLVPELPQSRDEIQVDAPLAGDTTSFAAVGPASAASSGLAAATSVAEFAKDACPAVDFTVEVDPTAAATGDYYFGGILLDDGQLPFELPKYEGVARIYAVPLGIPLNCSAGVNLPTPLEDLGLLGSVPLEAVAGSTTYAANFTITTEMGMKLKWKFPSLAGGYHVVVNVTSSNGDLYDDTVDACFPYNSLHLVIPIARPLFFTFPFDAGTLALKEQWMMGDALLISPMLRRCANSTKGYFPAGVWYNLYNYSAIDTTAGGQNVTVEVYLPGYLLGLRFSPQ